MQASDSKNVIDVEDIRTEHGLPLDWAIVATPGGFVAESPVVAGGKLVRIFDATGQQIGELGVNVATLVAEPESGPYATPDPFPGEPREVGGPAEPETAEPVEPERSEYIDAADVAKLVRARVKADFPGVKFSVRTSKYSMGASISVCWHDGPTTKQVDEAIGQYGGSGFDGSIDLKYSWSSWLLPDGSAQVAHSPGTTGSMGGNKPVDTAKPHADARLVHFGADYVFTSRVVTGGTGPSELKFSERVGRDLCALQGVEYTGPDTLQVLGAGDRDSVRYHVARLLSATPFPPGHKYVGVRYAGDDRRDPQVWAEIVLAPATD